MEIHEPRQVRKEAAVSETFHVPQGSLVGANCPGIACGNKSGKGARPLKVTACGKGFILLLFV